MKKIYIIHGWTYSVNAWDACIAHLQSAGYEPVILHVPGLTEESDKVWTLDEYISWLDSKLPAQGENIVIGHSNGGRIAIALAAKNPGRISRLILIDSAGIVHNELPIRMKRAVFGTMAKLGKGMTKSPTVRKIFYKIIGARDYGNAPTHMRETMTGLISIDLRDRLPRIAIPTLIMWGGHDSITPVSDAYVIKKAISGSKLVVLEGVGHSPHKDKPEQTAREINTWLEQS